MDAEREFELRCEDKYGTPVSRQYFWIDPNQFDGDREVDEQAAYDADVDITHDELKDAITAAKRLCKLVGHRVVVTEIIHTSAHGREYETAYTAMPCPIEGVCSDLAEILAKMNA